MTQYISIIIIALLFFIPSIILHAEEALPERLIVATRHIPPFAIMDKDGNWSGITIELWDLIAQELEKDYTLIPMSIPMMLEGLQNGSIDIAAAALSITSHREGIVDFSHPFYNTGLGIAVKTDQRPTWWRIIRSMLSMRFLEAFGALFLLLLIFGSLIWLFERKKNSSQFDKNVAKGIGSGFWWSAVTLTTVGYGDKAPVTIGGRIIAMFCMFFGIILASTITATIASVLTVAFLDTGIKGVRDLPYIRAGAILNTTSAEYFYNNGMHPVIFENAMQGLEAVESGEIDALVYDAPILEYLITQNWPGELTMLSDIFNRQQYGIALPFNSPMRQDINRILLALMESQRFNYIKQKYLGEKSNGFSNH